MHSVKYYNIGFLLLLRSWPGKSSKSQICILC